MKTARRTYNMYEFALAKKKNRIADTFGKYLKKSSCNNTYRMIGYLGVAIVLMGAQSLLMATQPAYAVRYVPYWMPFPIGGSTVPLHYFVVNLTHMTDQLGVMKTCVTDEENGHGACHYQNATEEEFQPAGKIFTADAGAFTFHPGSDLVKGDKMQICVTSLALDRMSCFHIKYEVKGDYDIIDIDMTEMQTRTPELIQRPEIGMFSFGGGVV